MSRRRVLIVGGSDAGTSAALSARSTDPGCQIDVLLEDRYPNYSVCGLPFLLSGEVSDWKSLAHRSETDFAEQQIDLHKEWRALSVDSRGHELAARGPGGERRFGYDALVIATGAEPLLPLIAGLDLDGVVHARTMDDGLRILEQIERAPVAAVTIVGGGYIGVELADAFTRRGASVTLVESESAPLKTLDPELREVVAAELRRSGVQIVGGCRVTGIERHAHQPSRLCVRGTRDLETVADLVIVSVGVRPRTGLAETAGCRLGEREAIRVSRRMETNVPDVFAAGDCVETWHRLLEGPTYLPLGTTAHKQGAIAGANAAGGASEFAGTLGTQVVKIFDLAAGRTGLLEHEATAAGFHPRTAAVVASDHKAYYPGATDLHIRLTGDDRDGRLLGAQIVGHYRAAVAKRLDVAATALFHGASVADLMDMDLSYTPPLGSPWDPWQVAARAWLDGKRASFSASRRP